MCVLEKTEIENILKLVHIFIVYIGFSVYYWNKKNNLSF